MDFLGEGLYGGVYGDIKEYGQEALGCVCCLLCSGPILLIVGIMFFVSSFTDTRMQLITEYNTDVDLWNNGPGLTNSFENQNFSVEVSSSSTSNSALLGMIAPEDIRDSPQRSSETFTDVKSPYYYKLEATNAASVFGVNTVTGNPTYSQALTTPHTVKVQHNGNTVAQLSDVYLMKSVLVQYKWYVSRSSSASSSSIDCRNPSYNYPGTRFSSKISCQNWCAQEAKGVWSTEGDCYPNFSGKVTGCCRVYHALEKACLKVTKATTGYTSSSSAGCVTGYNTNVPYSSTVKTATTSKAYSTSLVTPVLQYAHYQPQVPGSSYSATGLSSFALNTPLPGSSSGITFSMRNLDFSVRLDSDPFIDASRITSGCSSCSNQIQPLYGSGCTNTQCFGLTPAQKRQVALALILVGSLMMVFPCGLIYYLKSRGKKSNPPPQNYAGGGQQPVGFATQTQMFSPTQPQVAGAYGQPGTGYPQPQAYPPTAQGQAYLPTAQGQAFAPPAQAQAFAPPAQAQAFAPPAQAYGQPAQAQAYAQPAAAQAYAQPAAAQAYAQPAAAQAYAQPAAAQGFAPSGVV